MMTTLQQQLITALTVEKNLGKTPQQAIAAVNALSPTAASLAASLADVEKFDLLKIGAPPVATALSSVYPQGITPLAMGLILKSVGFTAPEIALALRSVYDVKPSVFDALNCGQVLLDKDMFATLARPGLIAALTAADYPSSESELAANVLYPISISVAANIAWQNTGLTVTGTQNTVIQYVSGRWSFNPQLAPCDANGNRGLIAKPYYTLPGAPEGALICKVGDKVFLAGNQYTLPAGIAGNLQLCINDDLDGRYGLGLKDNSGSLLISITTTAK